MTTKQLRARRDISETLNRDEFRVWRRFAKRVQETQGVELEWRPNADRFAIDKLFELCGDDVNELLELVDAAFARGDRPRSLMALKRIEDVRQFGKAGAA